MKMDKAYFSGLETGRFLGLFLPRSSRNFKKQHEMNARIANLPGTVSASAVAAIKKTMKEKAVSANPTVEDTLKERGSRYGSFKTHAEFAENINLVYESSDNWKIMKPDAKESLRIIANKIGRILNGDPEYDDNWRDIAGYATLVLKRIENDSN